MKKIVAMGAAVALAASMFAAEPAANAAVTEFTGNASVEWGVNLDTNKTGFKNSTDQNLKFKLFDGGSKSTEGSGIWAELKIKSVDDWGPAWKAENGTCTAQKAKVDTAKIHFDNFYVGILEGDTQTGALKFTRAIKSGDSDNGKLLSDVGPADYTQGIVAGYDDSNFGVAVDFRSRKANTETNPAEDPKYDGTQYTNDYAMAAEVTLKDSNEYLSGLEVKGGYSYEFADKPLMGYSGSVAYKATVSGDYYVKPAFGYTGASLDGTTTVNKIAGAVIFGWGDTADANAGVYFLDNDAATKKVTPGVSVSYEKDIKDDSNNGKIEAAFYLGNLVENLKAAALLDTTLVKEGDTPITVLAGCAYDVKADDITITPKAGISFKNKAAGNEVNVKAGVDVAGLINNTTFYAVYASNNLKADSDKKGTVNVGCKIAF